MVLRKLRIAWLIPLLAATFVPCARAELSLEQVRRALSRLGPADACHAGDPSVCDDLHEFACESPNQDAPERESIGDHREAIEEKLDGLMDAAREHAAKSLGFESGEAAVRARAARLGYPLPPQAKFHGLHMIKISSPRPYSPDFVHGAYEILEFAPALADCRLPTRSIEQAERAMREEMLAYREAAVSVYEATLSACSMFRGTITAKVTWSGPDESVLEATEMPAHCSAPSLRRMKAAAERAFLASGSEDEKRSLRRQFLDRHFDAYLGAMRAYAEGLRPRDSKAPLPAELAPRALHERLCLGRAEIHRRHLNREISRYVNQLSTSEAGWRHVEGVVYPPERRQAATRLFEELKSRMAHQLGDGEDVLSLRESLTELRLHLPTQDLSAFVHQPEDAPLRLIDPSRVPAAENAIRAYVQGDSAFFTDLNAFYEPDVKVGGTQLNAEGITLQPLTLMLLDTQPDAIAMILGHEIGHKISVTMTRRDPRWLSAVTDCLRGNDSIQLQPDQAEEARGDWLSREILVPLLQQRYVGASPTERRRRVTEALLIFCDSEKKTEGNLGEFVSFEALLAEHPPSERRMNGIFGADPRIRALLGCPAESRSAYRNCALPAR